MHRNITIIELYIVKSNYRLLILENNWLALLLVPNRFEYQTQ